MKKILLVGCGHMGSNLLKQWVQKKSYNISVIDPKTYRVLKKKYSKKISIYKSIDNIKNIEIYKIIIFAVKPQNIDKIISEYKSLKNLNVLYLSIIAGKKISFFKKQLSNSNQIIRVMPNMGAFTNQSMTSLVANKFTTKKNKLIASDLFKSVGKIIWLKNEKDIDKVTAVSGSVPAYFFLFVELLISQATKLGLKKNIAKELVYQTAIGSIDLLIKSNKNADVLKNNIAVKGGTTEAAIKIFEKNAKLKKIINLALNSAYKRSIDLGNE